MTKANINSEYLSIIQKEKEFLDKNIEFPLNDSFSVLKLKDEDNNEYIFDINRKGVRLTRCTYQERHNVSIVLLRLDLDSKPHRNPDGEKIEEHHIHVYTDDYGDSYAFTLDNPILNKINPNFDLNKFSICEKSRDKLYMYFEAFSEFCNIKNIPNVITNIIDCV